MFPDEQAVFFIPSMRLLSAIRCLTQLTERNERRDVRRILSRAPGK